ncbi:hypothetical protein RHMOL_Rhmol02G0049500 [Rhododendron molle]|uniref:Uncharacterized protein n=1 Tax=Rhododendron molle TaxID=49168 RepID=A0ACC0PNE3_RHOML|nr:hypothetical protein RHMOL_Rhmol02G0049500 [Rhododendron molle]
MDQRHVGMDQRHGGYFTNLMDSDLHEEQFVMESQCLNPNAQVFTQETQFTDEMGSIPKKPPRGGNFTMEEDKLLVSAWLNTSMDPIQAGRKGEKERSFQEQPMKPMKRKNKDITSSTQFVGALDEIKECKIKLVEKKLEMLGKTCDQEEEKIRIKKERLEMDKFKEDERVMMMDLNGLSEEQKEFYRYRKMEILDKRRVK